MVMTMQQMRPVAPLPLGLEGLRRLEVTTIIDRLIPPHPAPGLSCGRGVEALVLAMLDGDHALYKVGRGLEERGAITPSARASWQTPAVHVVLDGDVPRRQTRLRPSPVITSWWQWSP